MRLVKIIASLVAGVLAFGLIAVAKAQSRYDTDQSWIRKTIRKERHLERRSYHRSNLAVEYAEKWRSNPVRRRYYYAPPPTHRHYDHDRHHDGVRVYGAVRRLDTTANVGCYPGVEAYSVEANSEDGAWRDAQRNWENQVRAMVGEKWMDVRNALNVEKQCWVASGNQSVVGRVSEAVGRVVGTDNVDGRKHRCRILAKPCQAPIEQNAVVKGE